MGGGKQMGAPSSWTRGRGSEVIRSGVLGRHVLKKNGPPSPVVEIASAATPMTVAQNVSCRHRHSLFHRLAHWFGARLKYATAFKERFSPKSLLISMMTFSDLAW